MTYLSTWELESLNMVPMKDRCGLVVAMAKLLANLNYQWLLHYAAPPLYQSGVVYKYQNELQMYPDGTWAGGDRWQDIPRLLQTKAGACEDLAAWRVAELFMLGERGAKIDVDTAVKAGGAPLFHVVVRRQNGAIEDPSRILGMK